MYNYSSEITFAVPELGLYHFGVPHGKGPTRRGSGRYAWGTGKDPKGARKSYRKNLLARRAEKKKAMEAQRKRTEKLREQERLKRLEADKARVLREGNATEVLKYQGMLNAQELQDAYNRIKWENSLREYAAKETKSTVDRIDKIMEGVKKGTSWLKTGMSAYDEINKLLEIWDKESKSSNSGKSGKK